MNSMDRRTFLGALSLVSAGLLLPGCSTDDAEVDTVASSNEEVTETTSSPISSGGTFQCRIKDPICVDPYNVVNTPGLNIASQIFDCLTYYDYSNAVLAGRACSSWEANEDCTMFTFHLISGGTFHNEDLVTAADFKFGWERAVSPAVNPSFENQIHTLFSDIAGYEELRNGEGDGKLSGVVAQDDSTLVVTLSRPCGEFPWIVSHPAFSPIPHVADENFDTYWAKPIGNGPFQLDTPWVDQKSFRLSRFSLYPGDEVTINAVNFLTIRDDEQARSEFDIGNIDLTDIPEGEFETVVDLYGISKDGYVASPEAQVLEGERLNVTHVVFNTEDDLLKNKIVRQAITKAFDRSKVSAAAGSKYTTATGMLPKNITGQAESSWSGLTYEPTRAATLLYDLSYDVTNPDGSLPVSEVEVTEEESTEETSEESVSEEEVSREILTLNLLVSDQSVDGLIITGLSDDLKKLGIEVVIEQLPWDEYFTRLEAGDFQITCVTYLAPYQAPGAYVCSLYASYGKENFSRLNDPDIDALIGEAQAVAQDDIRIGKMICVDASVSDLSPYIPVFFSTLEILCSDRVSELRVAPSGVPDFRTCVLSA